MTQPITVTSLTAANAETTARTRAARSSGASFAQAHAAAVRNTKDKDADTAASGTSGKTKTSDAPKGERTQKVPGHSYVEIVSGPRNGMFINNTGNDRDGDAFVIVKRRGREFHIYGTGKERAVFEVGREREQAPAAGTNGSTGTAGSGTSATGTTAPATGTPATT